MAKIFYRNKGAGSEISIGPFATKNAALIDAASRGIAIAGVELLKKQKDNLIVVTTNKQARAAIEEARLRAKALNGDDDD